MEEDKSNQNSCFICRDKFGSVMSAEYCTHKNNKDIRFSQIMTTMALPYALFPQSIQPNDFTVFRYDCGDILPDNYDNAVLKDRADTDVIEKLIKYLDLPIKEVFDLSELVRQFNRIEPLYPPLNKTPNICMTAIPTKHGVLLFDDSENGKNALRLFIRQVADNYFKAENDVSEFQMYRKVSDDEALHTACLQNDFSKIKPFTDHYSFYPEFENFNFNANCTFYPADMLSGFEPVLKSEMEPFQWGCIKFHNLLKLKMSPENEKICRYLDMLEYGFNSPNLTEKFPEAKLFSSIYESQSNKYFANIYQPKLNELQKETRDIVQPIIDKSNIRKDTDVLVDDNRGDFPDFPEIISYEYMPRKVVPIETDKGLLFFGDSLQEKIRMRDYLKSICDNYFSSDLKGFKALTIHEPLEFSYKQYAYISRYFFNSTPQKEGKTDLQNCLYFPKSRFTNELCPATSFNMGVDSDDFHIYYSTLGLPVSTENKKIECLLSLTKNEDMPTDNDLLLLMKLPFADQLQSIIKKYSDLDQEYATVTGKIYSEIQKTCKDYAKRMLKSYPLRTDVLAEWHLTDKIKEQIKPKIKPVNKNKSRKI